MFEKAIQVIKDQRGQGMAEYGLILAGIAVVCIVAITLLGPKISDKFKEVGEAISGAGE